MKKTITLTLALLVLAGCSSTPKLTELYSTDGCFTWHAFEDPASIEGGPFVKQVALSARDEECKRLMMSRDTHAGIGTAQQLAKAATEGTFGILIEKERGPYATHDGSSSTEFNLQGSSAVAGSQSESQSGAEVNVNDNNDVFCYGDECQN